MNATYNIDHLQAVSNVTSLLASNSKLGDTVAVNKPKTATTTHFDPTGKLVAAKSTTSYEAVSFAADGTISGGSLAHESQDVNGVKLNSTAVSFGSDGKPRAATVNVSNVGGEGNFKIVQMDMSGVTWNNSLGVSAGAVAISTTDALTGQKKHDGVIQFDKEKIVSGSITHYDPANGGAISGYTDVDYAQTSFLGTSLVGGQYAVTSHNANKVLKSRSTVALSSLGRPQSIETTNLDPDTAAVTSKVAVDFSKLVFNALNEFHSGEINYTANDDQGSLLSQTTLTYTDAQPALSTTLVYSKGEMQNKIVVDYSASLFNNDHRVINSTKKVEVYSNTNQLLTANTISYDQQGNKLKANDPKAIQLTTSPPPKKNAVAAAAAVVAHPAVTMTVIKMGDPNTTQKTEPPITRADGTLQETRVTTMQGGKPVSSLITIYAADGKTIIKTFTLDLSSLNYDTTSNTVTGMLPMQTNLGGHVLQSQSSIQF